MDIGWRELTEVIAGVWLLLVSWIAKRFVDKVDNHEKRLSRMEHIAATAKRNSEAIRELRVETEINYRALREEMREQTALVIRAVRRQ